MRCSAAHSIRSALAFSWGTVLLTYLSFMALAHFVYRFESMISHAISAGMISAFNCAPPPLTPATALRISTYL